MPCAQVGLLVAYMLDTSRQKELALAAVWLTCGLAAVCNAFASWGQHAGITLHVTAVLAATGACCHPFHPPAALCCLRYKLCRAVVPLEMRCAREALLLPSACRVAQQVKFLSRCCHQVLCARVQC